MKETNQKGLNSSHIGKIEVGEPSNRITQNQLITLQGITTSQINQALKANNPYPARVFLKVDDQEHDIPVFFRIKDKDNWLRPKIKTNSLIEVQGYFSNSDKSRLSFTAYSYQLISCPTNQIKPYHCPVDCPCLRGQELKKQEEAQRVLRKAQDQFPYLQQQVEKIGSLVKEKLSHGQK